MSKNGDWERPEIESNILVVGSVPDKDAPVVGKVWTCIKIIKISKFYKKKSEL